MLRLSLLLGSWDPERGNPSSWSFIDLGRGCGMSLFVLRLVFPVWSLGVQVGPGA